MLHYGPFVLNFKYAWLYIAATLIAFAGEHATGHHLLAACFLNFLYSIFISRYCIFIDDFGLQALSQDVRITLLQLLEDRYEKRSIVITSQLPVSKW